MEIDPFRWYSLLECESSTDAIYDLLHGDLDADWEWTHTYDLVVINVDDNFSTLLPKGIPDKHRSTKLISSEYAFEKNSMVLIKDSCIRHYIENAKQLKINIDLYDREFIQLIFTEPERRKAISFINAILLPDNVLELQSLLPEAYNELKQFGDKAKALDIVTKSSILLEQWQIAGTPEEILNQIIHKMAGYNIAAMVYAWNGKVDRACQIDNEYLYNPALWASLEEVINGYLIMLMAMKHEEYLTYIFSHEVFKKQFFAQYEAYISLFINPNYEWTMKRKAMEILMLVGRVKY
jgi:hypothetical protein